MKISTIGDFRAALKEGPFAWPGGYPLFFICNDGAALSYDYAKENTELIEGAITDKDNAGGWLVSFTVKEENESNPLIRNGNGSTPRTSPRLLSERRGF